MKPKTAMGRGTGVGTPDSLKSLYDRIRTKTNRVESGKVRYDGIEPDYLRPKRCENPCKISLNKQ
jgi:hypothetical protein